MDSQTGNPNPSGPIFFELWRINRRKVIAVTIRILLADDHASMRASLRALIDRQPGMQVVAEAGKGRTTVELAGRLKPDIIMDINMPDLGGIHATGRILSDCPEAKVIGLSTYSDSQYAAGMRAAGASGFLLKDCAFEELARAIRTVVANQIYLGSGIEKNAAAFPGRPMAARRDTLTYGGVLKSQIKI